MDCGQNMKSARGDMSRKYVANELGISLSALALYESGDRVPRDELKVQLARLYGTTVGHLFFGE